MSRQAVKITLSTEERKELEQTARRRTASRREIERARVIATVCTERPEGSTHWTVRSLAARTGVGRDTVHRILRQEKLQPHRIQEWVMSTDPEFETKALDILGLYLNPPENAWS